MSHSSENLRKIGNAVWCMPIVAGMIGVTFYYSSLTASPQFDEVYGFVSRIHFFWVIATLIFGLAMAERFTRWPERVLPGVRNSARFVFGCALCVALAHLAFYANCDELFAKHNEHKIAVVTCGLLWLMAFMLFAVRVALCLKSRRVMVSLYGILIAILSVMALVIFVVLLGNYLPISEAFFDIFCEMFFAYYVAPLFFSSLLLLFFFLGIDLRKRAKVGFPELENLPTSEQTESSRFTPKERKSLELVRIGVLCLNLAFTGILVLGVYGFTNSFEARYFKTQFISIYALYTLFLCANICMASVPKSVSENNLAIYALVFQFTGIVFFWLFPILGITLLVSSLILLGMLVYRISCAFRTEGKNLWMPVLCSGATILFILIPSCVMYALSLPPYFLMKIGVIFLIVMSFVFIVSLIRVLSDISGNIQNELEKPLPLPIA